jgi:hypothetical protein
MSMTGLLIDCHWNQSPIDTPGMLDAATGESVGVFSGARSSIAFS